MKTKTWKPGETPQKKVGGKPHTSKKAPLEGEVLAAHPDFKVEHGGGGPTDAGWHRIEAALRCFKEYQFETVRGIHVPSSQMPDYFATGIGLHAGRARWFADKFPSDKKGWERIVEAVENDFENQKLPVSHDAKAYTLRLLKEYCEHWHMQPKPTPVVAEHLIGPAPLAEGDPFPLWRTARVDDASYYPESLGKLCVGEAKTTSSSINDCINQYTLHGQPSLQFVLWKMASQGEAKFGQLHGVMLDIIKKGYGKERSTFARHLVTFSDHMIAWYVKNMRMIMRALPNIEWNTDVPRNITMCTRLVGRQRVACQFRELCMHGKSASIKYLMGDNTSLLSWKPSGERQVPPWE
jgi:hypothetical protein